MSLNSREKKRLSHNYGSYKKRVFSPYSSVDFHLNITLYKIKNVRHPLKLFNGAYCKWHPKVHEMFDKLSLGFLNLLNIDAIILLMHVNVHTFLHTKQNETCEISSYLLLWSEIPKESLKGILWMTIIYIFVGSQIQYSLNLQGSDIKCLTEGSNMGWVYRRKNPAPKASEGIPNIW